MSGQNDKVALGPFTVDLGTRRLLRDGVDLRLRPRAFNVFQSLIHNRGRVVPYEDIVREAWGGISISNHTVAVTVREIKTALGENGSWIECRPKFGYCLHVPVSEDLLREGWHFRNQFTTEGFENALRCFQGAAQHAPADYRAFEAIAGTYSMMQVFMTGAPRQTHHKFLGAWNRAVELRGLTPELKAERAYFEVCLLERKLVEAEADLLEVQRERPTWADGFVRLAMVYAAMGRLDDALRQATAADVLAVPAGFIETVIRLYRREFDAAVACSRRSLALHPSARLRVYYGQALEFSGDISEALAQYQLAAAMAPNSIWIRLTDARCRARNGGQREASAVLEDLQHYRLRGYVDAYHLAALLEALGRRQEALSELQRAYDDGSFMLLWMGIDPKMRSLRDEPAFRRLRDKLLSRISRK
jgi:DNA-binding winged helix-turn-helix (wHTH) protein